MPKYFSDEWGNQWRRHDGCYASQFTNSSIRSNPNKPWVPRPRLNNWTKLLKKWLPFCFNISAAQNLILGWQWVFCDCSWTLHINRLFSSSSRSMPCLSDSYYCGVYWYLNPSQSFSFLRPPATHVNPIKQLMNPCGHWEIRRCLRCWIRTHPNAELRPDTASNQVCSKGGSRKVKACHGRSDIEIARELKELLFRGRRKIGMGLLINDFPDRCI